MRRAAKLIAPRAWLRARSLLHVLRPANDNDAPEPPPSVRKRRPVPGGFTVVDAGRTSGAAAHAVACAA